MIGTKTKQIIFINKEVSDKPNLRMLKSVFLFLPKT